MLSKSLIAAAGNGQETGEVAEAIDFDGTNDGLSRSSALTGSTITTTYTVSFWIYNDEVKTAGALVFTDTSLGTRFSANTSSSGELLRIYAVDVDDLASFDITFNLPIKGWNHVLLSISSSIGAGSLYVNDQPQSGLSVMTSASGIRFNTNRVYVGTTGTGSALKGRLAHVYQDYTYRDLSNVNNRRLFVTADLKPAAGQAALNPILYLPMDDPTAPGANAGTGGNFTLSGTVARSGRGPNQYNAPYSDLDGSADYLSRTTAPTGIADGNKFTFHCCFSVDTFGSGRYLLAIATAGSVQFEIFYTSSGQIRIDGVNSSFTTLLDVITPAGTVVAGRNYVLDVSIDLSNSSLRHFYVNGASVAATRTTYVNGNIDFAVTSTPAYLIGAGTTTPSFVHDGRLGALWFNTSYIDLSVASNLAKFVSGTGINAKPVDLGASGELPTGTSPLIYLPMYGNNAGKNYGTGGDFTVNSGPYTGARGPNEFWGNKADFNGTNGYLRKASALTGVSDGKVVSGSFWFVSDAANVDDCIFSITDASGNGGFRIYRSSTNTLLFRGFNSGTSTILYVETGTLSAGTNYYVQYCFDLNNSANRAVYVNGVAQSLSVTTYTNDTLQLTLGQVCLATRWTGSATDLFDGRLSEFYFTTTYIDFSQEANRLKFRDAFGNPVDLTQQIEAAAIPNPAIYMRFPPTSFGTNSGTGGNFTVNGTISDGGQL